MRLFVIGNGFDLSHGLETKYKDFKKYIEQTYLLTFNQSFLPYPVVGEEPDGGIVADPNTSAQILCNLLENVPIESDWSNFEDCLGELDYHPALDLAEKDDENPFHTQYNLEDLISDLKPSLLVGVFNIFKEWIDSIDISKAKKQFYFKDSDMFLAFNYTGVLENIYNINRHNICHIHGPFQDGRCVTGHGNVYRNFDDYDELVSFQIKEISDSLLKPVVDLYNKQAYFFSLLKKKNIDEIIFYGFSFGDVDLYYIEQLFKIIDTEDTKMYFSEYEHLNEKTRKLKIIKRLGFQGTYDGPFLKNKK